MQKNNSAIFVLPTFAICMLPNGFLKEIVRKMGSSLVTSVLGLLLSFLHSGNLYISWAYGIFSVSFLSWGGKDWRIKRKLVRYSLISFVFS